MRITVKMTADELMDVIGAIGDEAVEQDIYVDPLYGNDNMEQILKVVDAALSAMGIEIEEEEEEPEDFDEDDFDFDFDFDDEEEEIESIIYDVGGRCGISEDDAHLLIQCVAKVMKEQYGYLPEELMEILVTNEASRIAKVYGIEVVDMEGE